MKFPIQRVAFASLFALSALTFSGCGLLGDDEEAQKEEPKVEAKKEEPKKAEPKKIEIPAYAPTGDDAELKAAGAKDISAENALEKAKALEAALDADLAAAKAKKAH